MCILGLEPWSSGSGRRLMFKKMYVQITASYTGWIVIHINLLQTLYGLFDKSKNHQKGVLYEKWH